MFIQSIGKPMYYPVPIVDNKKPDFDLYTFRTYKTISGNIVQIADFQIVKKGENIFGDKVRWNQKENDYIQTCARDRKIKSIQVKGLTLISPVLKNQLKMEL